MMKFYCNIIEVIYSVIHIHFFKPVPDHYQQHDPTGDPDFPVIVLPIN